MFEVFKNHLGEILQGLLYLVIGLELFARLTPTKKDDGFLERVGALIRKLLDILHIPNIKR